MNLIAWLLAISTLITLMIQAVSFQKATVCRQEAWLKSTELKTRSLLHQPSPVERDWHLNCRIHLLRNQDEITWQRLPHLKKHEFRIDLEGSL
jgi:hypothetical protein